MRFHALTLAAVLAAASLAGCGRGADSGATANPNAPGSPGSGNPAQARAPQAPDGPPGGPSGVKGSAPHTGASGGDAVPGATGRGLDQAGSRSQTAQPGSGLQGGLGASSGQTAMGAGPSGASGPESTGPQGTAASGSSNRSPSTSVGNRP